MMTPEQITILGPYIDALVSNGELFKALNDAGELYARGANEAALAAIRDKRFDDASFHTGRLDAIPDFMSALEGAAKQYRRGKTSRVSS